MYLQVKMPEMRRKTVFRGKETTNKVPSNIFGRLEDGKMLQLMF